MLSTKDKGILLQIIKHCTKINTKMKSVSYKQFYKNEDLREIICFNIFQIGELAKNLSSVFTKYYNQVPWKQIKGMRDIIGHGYGTIDVEIVYNTAKNDIVELLNYCKEVLYNENIDEKTV